jgi:hypothetical protein
MLGYNAIRNRQNNIKKEMFYVLIDAPMKMSLSTMHAYLVKGSHFIPDRSALYFYKIFYKYGRIPENSQK